MILIGPKALKNRIRELEAMVRFRDAMNAAYTVEIEHLKGLLVKWIADQKVTK